MVEVFLFLGRVTSIFVEGASNGESAFREHVGIDHSSSDIVVAEEFLDGADVVALFEEVGGEGVAEGVAACVFGGA